METNKLIVMPAKIHLMIHIKCYQPISKRHIHEQIHKIISINMKKYPRAH